MGGRPPDVTDEELIEALEKALEETGDPVVFASEIEPYVPIKAENLNPRLEDLMESTRVKGKKPGNSWIWWMSESTD